MGSSSSRVNVRAKKKGGGGGGYQLVLTHTHTDIIRKELLVNYSLVFHLQLAESSVNQVMDCAGVQPFILRIKHSAYY